MSDGMLARERVELHHALAMAVLTDEEWARIPKVRAAVDRLVRLERSDAYANGFKAGHHEATEYMLDQDGRRSVFAP